MITESELLAGIDRANAEPGATFGPGEYVLCDIMCDPRPRDFDWIREAPSVRHGGQKAYHGLGALAGTAFMLHSVSAYIVPLDEYEAAVETHGPSFYHRQDADRGLARNHGARFTVREELSFDPYFHNPRDPVGGITGTIDGVPFGFRAETFEEYKVRFEESIAGLDAQEAGTATPPATVPSPVVVSRDTARAGGIR